MFAIFVLFLYSIVFASGTVKREGLKCIGYVIRNVSLSAYYPVFDTDNERDHVDEHGYELQTLQDYTENRAFFITVASNLNSGIPYGTKVCIEKLNEHYGRQLPLEIRDQRDHQNREFKTDFSRLKICVRTEEDTYEKQVNEFVTIHL